MTDTRLAAARPTGPAPSAQSPSRVIPVLRLHLVNRANVFLIPWYILAFIFLINITIWWIVMTASGPGADAAEVSDGLQWSGASFYIFVYMMVLGIQAVAYTFPFALGYSATRRDFWLGTSLAFVLLAVLYAAGMTVLAVIEQATNGWGFGGRMFTVLYFGGDDAPWFERFFVFFALFAFFFFVGAVIATIYQRWRVNGMLVFFGALVLVLLGLAALVTLGGAWPAVGEWFVASGPTGVVAWTLVPTVLSAVLGYLILRRATPRS